MPKRIINGKESEITDEEFMKGVKSELKELNKLSFDDIVKEENAKYKTQKIKENINNPYYWDKIYTQEIRDNFIRPDVERWEIITSYIKPTDTVLDFGCGWGEYIKWLAPKRPYAKFIGIDYSAVAIKKAEELMPNFEWLKTDNLMVYTYSEKNKNELKRPIIDVITMQHVLEHCDNKDELVEEAYDSLNKNGILIVVVPLYDDWREHPKIWTVESTRKWLQKFSDKFKAIMIYRPETTWTKPDKTVEEAIIVFQKR